jgi:hypothetical protein
MPWTTCSTPLWGSISGSILILVGYNLPYGHMVQAIVALFRAKLGGLVIFTSHSSTIHL